MSRRPAASPRAPVLPHLPVFQEQALTRLLARPAGPAGAQPHGLSGSERNPEPEPPVTRTLEWRLGPLLTTGLGSGGWAGAAVPLPGLVSANVCLQLKPKQCGCPWIGMRAQVRRRPRGLGRLPTPLLLLGLVTPPAHILLVHLSPRPHILLLRTNAQQASPLPTTRTVRQAE